jgi:hypothetical protein
MGSNDMIANAGCHDVTLRYLQKPLFFFAISIG